MAVEADVASFLVELSAAAADFKWDPAWVGTLQKRDQDKEETNEKVRHLAQFLRRVDPLVPCSDTVSRRGDRDPLESALGAPLAGESVAGQRDTRGRRWRFRRLGRLHSQAPRTARLARPRCFWHARCRWRIRTRC